MPILAPGDVHVDEALTNVSVAYFQDQSVFGSARLFPVVPVAKKTDKYFVWDKASLYKTEAKMRGAGAVSPIRESTLSSDSYSCDVWSVREMIEEQAEANADAAVKLEETKTQAVMQDLMLRREIDWCTTYFAASVWTTEYTGIASGIPSATQCLQWDQSGSTPIANMRAALRAVQTMTGYMPNRAAISGAVFDVLADHPDILGRIQYTQKAVVTADLIASLIGVKELVVLEAVRNTANEGATAAYSSISGKHFLCCYAPDSPGINIPSAGYTFGWTGLKGMSAIGTRIKRFEVAERAAEFIEGEAAWDHKLTAAGLGAFINGAIA